MDVEPPELPELSELPEPPDPPDSPELLELPVSTGCPPVSAGMSDPDADADAGANRSQGFVTCASVAVALKAFRLLESSSVVSSGY